MITLILEIWTHPLQVLGDQFDKQYTVTLHNTHLTLKLDKFSVVEIFNLGYSFPSFLVLLFGLLSNSGQYFRMTNSIILVSGQLTSNKFSKMKKRNQYTNPDFFVNKVFNFIRMKMPICLWTLNNHKSIHPISSVPECYFFRIIT